MNKWMKIAYDEAKDGMFLDEGGPFGAVIVKDDKIIASSHNEVLKTKDPTAHAEINAIRKACKELDRFDLSDCVLYTTCKPCPMCLGAIFWARIKTVYYGANEHDAESGGFDDKEFYEMIKGDKSNLDMQQIDQDKNAELFDMWLAKENRQTY